MKSNIEMMYLADEMFKQKNKTIRFSVRDCIDLSSFHPEKTDKEVSDAIRQDLYSLKN